MTREDPTCAEDLAQVKDEVVEIQDVMQRLQKAAAQRVVSGISETSALSGVEAPTKTKTKAKAVPKAVPKAPVAPAMRATRAGSRRVSQRAESASGDEDVPVRGQWDPTRRELTQRR